MLITSNKRDYSIDWLKTIGTLCIFLAHVDAPFWLNEIRGFDVPLMVFLSGMLAEGSLTRSSNISSYVVKRIKRLVIPTWIFLMFFYLCMAAVNQLPDIETIIKSFLFQRDGGIAGYTWIIWIYIICSVITPFLIKEKQQCLVLYIPLLITFEIMCCYTQWTENRLMYYTLFTIIPYGIFLVYVINFNRHTIKYNTKFAIIIGIIHVVYSVILYEKYSVYVPIGDYKYPARFYYFSYAIPIITFLYLTIKGSRLNEMHAPLIVFISRNSLWIYLWHIYILAIQKYVLRIDHWILNYILLVITSVGITYIQSLFVQFLMKKHNLKIFKYLIG